MRLLPGKRTAPSLENFPWASLGRRESKEEFAKKCKDQRARVQLFGRTPKITIVVPVTSSVPAAIFELTLQSLREQTYPYFEVWVVGGRGTSLHRAVVDALGDDRFHAMTFDPTPTQAILKNHALTQAAGDWWGVVDGGDILSPVALYLAAIEINSKESPDVIYTNESVVDESFRSLSGFLSKPEYSWFDLLHFNYVGRFWLVNSTFAKTVGVFDDAAGIHHEHDFLLRASEKSDRFRLCPYFTYYRRSPIHVESASTRQVEVVRAHLERKMFAADINLNDRAKAGSTLRVTPALPDLSSKKVSAIICFRDRADWTLKSLESLSRHRGKVALEVFLVNNQSTPAELSKVESGISSFDFPVTIVPYAAEFNFAAMHNRVIRDYSKGDFVFLLNNDVFLSGSDQLDELVAWASQSWVGTVGILLRYPNGSVQHGGLQALYGGEARLARLSNSQREDVFAFCSREVFGNSFAACLIRRATFDAVGGLREVDYPNGFGDVIFNFECLRRGLRNIYLGYIEGVHMESASRGVDYEYWEECGIEREYPDILQKMLRFDLGYDRVPGGDFALKSLVRQALGHTLREKMPWLNPLKPRVLKAIRHLPFS